MLDAVLSMLKDNWRPSAPLPIIAALGFGVALLLFRRTARWGRVWLTAVVLSYWMLSTPLGAWVISSPLTYAQPRIESREEAQGARAIVMLGGGIVSHVVGPLAIDDLRDSAVRLIEGIRVYRLLGDAVLIVSGGNTPRRVPPRPEAAAFRTTAIGLGVPAEHIIVEDRSLTTREQAIAVKRLAAVKHADRIVLVTSPIHMPRAIASFRAVGLSPIPSASSIHGGLENTFWTLVPDRAALAISDHAIYEYVAYVYYWLRGWLRAP